MEKGNIPAFIIGSHQSHGTGLHYPLMGYNTQILSGDLVGPLLLFAPSVGHLIDIVILAGYRDRDTFCLVFSDPVGENRRIT